VLERILTVAIIIIAVGVALMTFDKIRQVGVSLLASAGIAGIILGFAAQKSIATILAGFQIALTQPIRIDDVVVVEGEFGWVEEITLTYVSLRIWDKRRLIVPIIHFIDQPFQNWTRVDSEILGTVFIYTDYSIPFEKLRAAFLDILNETDLWDKQVGVMQVTDSKEKTVEIRLLMSAPSAPQAWDLRVYVREKIIEYLQEFHPESLPQYRVQMIKEN
jgi:small-conductance mechanosensitive channel